MKKKDFKEFLRLMAVMQEVFTPEKPVSEQKAEIYFNAFQDWTIEQFSLAVSKIIQTKTISTFPLPAELKQALSGSIEDIAFLAFEKFRKGVERCGDWHSAVFDDPLIHAVVQHLGGWPEVTTKTKNEWVWLRKNFLSAYQIFLRHGINPDEVPKVLTCSSDAWNEARGFLRGKVKYFGDKKLALEWTAKGLPEHDEA